MKEINLKAFCAEAGVKFYDSELVSENGRKIYRIYIMKDGGVGLDDCARLSELLSPIFDVRAPVEGEYFLEISSPGLERKLSKIEHFKLSLGEKAKIQTNQKLKFEGQIENADDEFIEFKLLHDLNDENLGVKICAGELLKLKFSDIKKARTFIEW